MIFMSFLRLMYISHFFSGIVGWLSRLLNDKLHTQKDYENMSCFRTYKLIIRILQAEDLQR